jgi:hypothetical protein
MTRNEKLQLNLAFEHINKALENMVGTIGKPGNRGEALSAMLDAREILRQLTADKREA